jgi:cellulose biosynthesis protein BcsQ
VKIITIWCGKGGVGKSSITKNLACYLSIFEKKKVLVIDKDSQRSTYANFSDRDDSPFSVVDSIPKSFEGYDYVVCDMPPLTENSENPLSVDQLRIIENSDLIVSPFQPDDLTLKSMLSIYNANTNAIIQPVLNRFRSQAKLHKEAVSKIDGCLVLKERHGAYDHIKANELLFDKLKSTKALSDARFEFKELARALVRIIK